MQAQHKSLKRVLIMAGGTGGHVFPGLAVADYLRHRGVEVHWLGTQQGLEAKLVPEAHYPLHLVQITGLRGKGLPSLFLAPFKIITAILQSRRIIKEVNPDVVLGMGGFVSGPGGVASWISHRPLIVHEQNAKAGFTNKILSRFAKRVLEGFPRAFSRQSKVVTVGNPIREAIECLPLPEERLSSTAKCRLLVLGGSLGAKALNEIVPRALSMLSPDELPEIFHQTGERHIEDVKQYYASRGIAADIQPFVKDMAKVYGWADIVICRAGALTVSELCAAGLGAILIPFPYAVDDHQTANALFMAKQKAALCIQQKDLTDKQLASLLKQFSQSPEKRLAMARAAFQLRKVKVTERIFDILSECI